MSLSTFSGDFIDTALSQLGASRIKVVSGKQHVVDFDLGEGLTLTYIFTITNENRCYLQRARPYPMVQGRLASTEEVLQFIARDRQAFQNARRSRNYSTFLDTARKTLALTHKMEELFITHNLSPEDLALLHQQGDRLTSLMDEIRARSPEVSCEE